VKPETQAHIDKAAQCLRKAHAGLLAARTVPDMAENAARDAYYAAFHAAKALIFERTGKVHKSHGGVHTEFNRLARSEPDLNLALRTFLKKSYAFKASADYEASAAASITPELAEVAVDDAEKFFKAIARLLAP
jgi:uncharacterized protein (UPF0332 family)